MYKTLPARLSAFILTAFCALCAQAESVVILDQLPAPGMYSGGFISDTSCQIGSPPTAVSASVADDFRVQPPPGQAALDIMAVRFIGRYVPSGRVPDIPTPFVLRIRDDAGGFPGAVRAALTPTGFSWAQMAPGVFQFSISVAPVNLGPGFYWLEVAENGNATTDCWQWTIGPLDTVNGRDGNALDGDFDGPSGWGRQLIPSGEGDNVAMQIVANTIDDVPTPTAVPLLARESLMLLGGLLALTAIWMRRKVQR